MRARVESVMRKFLWSAGVLVAGLTTILALVATESLVNPIAVIALGGASFLFLHASQTMPS